MVTIHPRLVLFMAAAALLLFFLVCRFDPARPHARVLKRTVAGLFLLLAWNALPLFDLGINPLSMLLTGSLGLPGLGLMAVLARLP